MQFSVAGLWVVFLVQLPPHDVSLLICSVEKLFKLMHLKLVLFYRNLQLTPYQCLFACTIFCSKIAIEVFALKAHLKLCSIWEHSVLLWYWLGWLSLMCLTTVCLTRKTGNSDEMMYVIPRDQAVLYCLFQLPTFPNPCCNLTANLKCGLYVLLFLLGQNVLGKRFLPTSGLSLDQEYRFILLEYHTWHCSLSFLSATSCSLRVQVW